MSYTLTNNGRQAMRVFISAEYYKNDEVTNAVYTKFLAKQLRNYGLRFEVAEGCYKGTKEVTFIVNLSNDSDFVKTMKLGAMYNQESILVVDKSNRATLIYVNNGRSEYLGKMVSSLSLNESKVDAYTKLNDGSYLRVI